MSQSRRTPRKQVKVFVVVKLEYDYDEIWENHTIVAVFASKKTAKLKIKELDGDHIILEKILCE